MKQKMIVSLLALFLILPIQVTSANTGTESIGHAVGGYIGSIFSKNKPSSTQVTNIDDINQLKLQTIKEMYEEAFVLSEIDVRIKYPDQSSYDSAISVYKYADDNFKRVIKFAVNNMYDEGGVSICANAYYNLRFETNGFHFTEVPAGNFKYSNLENGDVRVVIDEPTLGYIRDYSLECKDGSCKITDVNNYRENGSKYSVKNQIKQKC